jgi:hypothetical protein
MRLEQPAAFQHPFAESDGKCAAMELGWPAARIEFHCPENCLAPVLECMPSDLVWERPHLRLSWLSMIFPPPDNFLVIWRQSIPLTDDRGPAWRAAHEPPYGRPDSITEPKSRQVAVRSGDGCRGTACVRSRSLGHRTSVPSW